jgi:uncharacterized iron-regulated membrane protein
MPKFLNKYVRKLHRWLALPFVVLILTIVLTRDTPLSFAVQRAQQILMLAMALTGLYLFILPWWAKWLKRERRG